MGIDSDFFGGDLGETVDDILDRQDELCCCFLYSFPFCCDWCCLGLDNRGRNRGRMGFRDFLPSNTARYIRDMILSRRRRTSQNGWAPMKFLG